VRTASRSETGPGIAAAVVAILQLVFICPKRYFTANIHRALTPFAKDNSMTAVSEFIANEVKSNDVVLFMKGTPGFPQCGFSGQVVQILDHLGVDYKGINVLTSDELRNGIKEYANWPTIPQLYVKGEFVGGCDIVREMFQQGELQDFMTEKGVAVNGAA
jgi:monothiol glutaredoxin